MPEPAKDAGRLNVLARRLVFSNSQFDVYADRVEEPDGSIVPDWLVVAPKRRTSDGITGAAIVPVIDGRIALLKVFRHPAGECFWEVPRGFIEANEDVRTLAARELEEETGLVCPPDQLVFLGLFDPEPAVLLARVHLYAALSCVAERPFKANETGHVEMRTYSPDEITHMLRDGTIRDPSTFVACSRYLDGNHSAPLGGGIPARGACPCGPGAVRP